MAFMAMILGGAAFFIFFIGVVLLLIGVVFSILYLVKRRKYKGQKKPIKVVLLVLAIFFLVIGLIPTIGVPTIISSLNNAAKDSSVSPKDYPIVNAIIKHDNDKLEFLLKNGVDPNEKCQGNPAIFWASSNSNDGVDFEAVKLLLKYKANMHAISDDGVALMPFILAGEVSIQDQDTTYNIVNYLIDNGYNVNETDSDGITLLMYATVGSSSFPDNTLESKLIKLLISRRANVNAKDHLGRTALMWECGFNEADGFDNTDATKPSINAKGNLGEPYLPCRVSDIETLINAGADINAKNVNGFIALDYFRAVEKFTIGYGDYDPAHNGPDPTDFNNYNSDCRTIEKLLQIKK